jgi:UDP-glucose 4-epimerase
MSTIPGRRPQTLCFLPSGETVNISTDNQITINELIPLICTHYGYTGMIVRKPGRHSDVLSHNASNAKVKTFIQYSLTPFESGLAETLNWYSKRIGGNGQIR